MKKLFSSTKIALGVAAITGGILAGAVPAKVQAAPLKRLVLAVKGEPEQGFDPIKGWGEYGHPLFQSTLIKHDANLKLVGDLAGAYSRRINIQHRLVYQVLQAQRTVKVLRMWTHYE